MDGIETALPGPDAPEPPRQEEIPFAVVDGEPVTDLPGTSTYRRTRSKSFSKRSRGRSTCCST